MKHFPKPVVGCCAYSGTGKTTLLAAVIPLLTKRGLKVSVIKHTHHSFDIDRPGKDSFRLRQAGARQVVLASKERSVCMTEIRSNQAEPVLADALAELKPDLIDLVLVEGFKHESFAKILLHRPALGHPLPSSLPADIVAVASDEAVATGNTPLLDLNRPQQVADFIIAYFNLTHTTLAESRTIMTTTEQDCCADTHDQNLTPAQARQQILDSITPQSTLERLALRDALDRVLGATIISPVNVPSHNNSAMDGYAMLGTDLPTTGHADLQQVGSALAGLPFAGRCQAGQCVRIMTGACIPSGTDTVVIQERVERLAENTIRIATGGHTGQNIRQAGEDITQGDEVLSPGRRLTAADIGIIASLGISEVDVIRRPRVAFFSTGDELRSIGQPLRDGDVYDSNRYSLYAMLKRLNIDVLDLGVVADQPELMREVLRNAAKSCDVVITSGGVSVGDADYIKPLLQKMGKMSFWKIAMKPGRPLVFGELDNAAFFGLPGNPVAVMVTFYQFVLPALQKLSGQQEQTMLTFTARCSHTIQKRAGRFDFQRGILQPLGQGRWQVSLAGQQGSGILTSMSRANCFVLLDEQCDGVETGDLVEVQPFAGLI